jgi:hypothetical protein
MREPQNTRRDAKTRLFRHGGGGVEDDVQWNDLRGLGVAVHQESLANLGYIVRELIGGRNLGAQLSAEQWRGVAGSESFFTTDRHCRFSG